MRFIWALLRKERKRDRDRDVMFLSSCLLSLPCVCCALSRILWWGSIDTDFRELESTCTQLQLDIIYVSFSGVSLLGVDRSDLDHIKKIICSSFVHYTHQSNVSGSCSFNDAHICSMNTILGLIIQIDYLTTWRISANIPSIGANVRRIQFKQLTMCAHTLLTIQINTNIINNQLLNIGSKRSHIQTTLYFIKSAIHIIFIMFGEIQLFILHIEISCQTNEEEEKYIRSKCYEFLINFLFLENSTIA